MLANRIALLKQEEMKTWKKIEETKKRTNDITGLKKRNEEKVQKVGNGKLFLTNSLLASIENLRHQSGQRNAQANELEQLHAI